MGKIINFQKLLSKQSHIYPIVLAGFGIFVLVLLLTLLRTYSPMMARTRQSPLLSPAEIEVESTYTGPVATILEVQGSVTYERNGSAYTASAQTTLIEADTVHTGNQSKAAIVFATGSLIRLDADTTITISRYSHTDEDWMIQLSQVAGNTWSRVQKLLGKSTYEIQTSTTVATVRGTAFAVNSSQSASDIAVAEGVVTAKIVDPEQIDKTLAEISLKSHETTSITREHQKKAVQTTRSGQPNTQVVRDIKPKKITSAIVQSWVNQNLQDDDKILPKIESLKQELQSKDKLQRLRAIQVIQQTIEKTVPLSSDAATISVPLSASATPQPTTGTRVNTLLDKMQSAKLTSTPTSSITPTPASLLQRSTTTDSITKITSTPTPTPVSRIIITPTTIIRATSTPTPVLKATPYPTPTPGTKADTGSILVLKTPTPTPTSIVKSAAGILN